MIENSRNVLSGHIALIEVLNRPFYRFAIVAEQTNRDHPFIDSVPIYGTVTFNKNKREVVADSLNTSFSNLEIGTQQWIEKKLIQEIHEFDERSLLIHQKQS
ncbi:hypothetical protein [Domibacillus robiginosus]|uniref:hypothetical protein n=1 Tax=Domibacillus robiginosus TaxID=1071054 RepID=UPI00067C7004|nr:hypothetical protein [Domibacillus robiginosus]